MSGEAFHERVLRVRQDGFVDGTSFDSRLTYDNCRSVRGIVTESLGFAGQIEGDSRGPVAAHFGGRL